MTRESQAKLYFLFMLADGSASKNEKKLFDSICRELSVDGEAKKNITSDCIKITKEMSMSCLDVIKANTTKDYVETLLRIDFNKSMPKVDKASILWNLINLGYADSHYTREEREVVEYLRIYLGVADSIYHEMMDVAETMLSLENYKTWVEANLPDDYYKDEKLNKIEKDIKYAQKSIKLSISEIM